MRRREFIALLGGTSAAAAWPLVARAERIARVGYLGLTSATSVQATRIDALTSSENLTLSADPFAF
jgi:hypothetical protein